jgi:hypothetical protein
MIMALLALLGLLAAPDAVFLSHEVTLDCTQPDSGYVETTIERIVPLTARGVERYRTLTVSYRSTWESVEILQADVSHWRPGRGGDPAATTEGPHGSLLPGDRLESSLRMVQVEYPGVEIGDTISIAVERRIDRLPMGDFYSFTFIPAGRDSVTLASLTVRWSTDRDMLVSGSLGGGETLPDDGDSRITRWVSGPSEPFPALPFTPAMVHLAPSVTIASHSPREVSAGLWRVLDLPCTVGPELLADSIIAVAGADPGALSAWVSREVEYMSGDWGLDPGYSPRTPVETLADMSGVCRDRAVLLVWLLRRAGFDAWLALTSSSADIGDLVGSRSFDHMLVMLTDGQGGETFIDPTLVTSTEGFTYGLRGAACLALTPEGRDLLSFPADPGSTDAMDITARLSCDPESLMLSGDVEVRFSGSADELFRSMLIGVPEASRSELLRTLLGASEGSFSVPADLSDPSTGLFVRGTGSWVVPEGSGGAIVLPGLETFDLVASRAAAFLLPPVIREPLVETPYRSSLMLEITGLGALRWDLPAPLAQGSFSSGMTLSGDTLRLEEKSSLMPIYPSQEELREMRLAMLARLSAAPRTLVPL